MFLISQKLKKKKIQKLNDLKKISLETIDELQHIFRHSKTYRKYNNKNKRLIQYKHTLEGFFFNHLMNFDAGLF